MKTSKETSLKDTGHDFLQSVMANNEQIDKLWWCLRVEITSIWLSGAKSGARVGGPNIILILISSKLWMKLYRNFKLPYFWLNLSIQKNKWWNPAQKKGHPPPAGCSFPLQRFFCTLSCSTSGYESGFLYFCNSFFSRPAVVVLLPLTLTGWVRRELQEGAREPVASFRPGSASQPAFPFPAGNCLTQQIGPYCSGRSLVGLVGETAFSQPRCFVS